MENNLSNNKLNNARKVKNDEFYTRYEDIEDHFSLEIYKNQFNNKVIYLPCDNPNWSNFAKYFLNNFAKFNIKKLIISFYGEKSFITEKTKDEVIFTSLNENGDFNNNEMDKYYEMADWVITNPPFSKINDLFKKLNKYNLQLTLILPNNSWTYLNVLPKFINNQLFVLPRDLKDFYTNIENTETKRVSGFWTSTLNFKKDEFWTEIEYDENIHHFIDGHDDIININRSHQTVLNWDKKLSVPISYLARIDLRKWKVIGLLGRNGLPKAKINGKELYKRLLIERIK